MLEGNSDDLLFFYLKKFKKLLFKKDIEKRRLEKKPEFAFNFVY